MARPTVAAFDSGTSTATPDGSFRYFTTSKTFLTGKLYVLAFGITRSGGGPFSDPPSVVMTNGGAAWTERRYKASGNNAVALFVISPAADTTGTVTITLDNTATGWDWAIAEITNFDTTSPITQGGDASGTSTTPSATMASAPDADARTIGFCWEGAGGAFTVGSNFTDVAQTSGHGTPSARADMEVDTSAAQQTADWTIASAAWIVVMVEVAPQPPASLDLGLISVQGQAQHVFVTALDRETEVGALAVAGTATPTIANFASLGANAPLIGFFANHRVDDPVVWTEGDGFDDDRNALQRLEDQLGFPIDVDRVYRPLLTAVSQPDPYLTWTQDTMNHQMILSLKSRNDAGTVTPYGKILTGFADTFIDAWADALVTLAPTKNLWLCYNHEMSLDEAWAVPTTGPGGTGTTIPCSPTPVARANGQTVIIKSTGQQRTLSGAHPAGSTQLFLTASTTWGASDTVVLQTTAQAGADFVAAWRYIKDRMMARPGFAALPILWTPIYINSSVQFTQPATHADLWYPGATYVDAIGWDGAYTSAPVTLKPSDYFDTQGFAAWAAGKSKPTLICECGYDDDGAHVADSEAWMANLGTRFVHDPKVQVVAYFTGAALGFYLGEAPSGSAGKLAAYKSAVQSWATNDPIALGSLAVAGSGAPTVSDLDLSSPIPIGLVELDGAGALAVSGMGAELFIGALGVAGLADASASFGIRVQLPRVIRVAPSYQVRVRGTVYGADEDAGDSFTDLIVGGQVDMDATADVTRSARVDLVDPLRKLTFDPGAGFVYAHNFILLQYGKLRGDVWVDEDVFFGPVTKFTRAGALVTVEAQGKESLLLPPAKQPTLVTPLDTRLDRYIKDVAGQFGETKFALEELTGLVVQKGESIGVAKADDLGGAWGYLKALAAKNGFTLFYDRHGRLTARSATTQSTAHTFATGELGTILDEPSAAYDMLVARNRVVVTYDSSKKQGLTATVDLPDSHPLSSLSLAWNGARRYLVEEVALDGTHDLDAAKAYGGRVLAELNQGALDVRFQCLPEPTVEVKEWAQLSTTSLEEGFRLNAYTLPLTDADSMTVGYTRTIFTRYVRGQK